MSPGMNISIPRIFAERLEFAALSDDAAKAFVQRLSAIREICASLASEDLPANQLEFADYLDDLELDVSIHQEYGHRELSRWLVHCSWTFEVTASSMMKELENDSLLIVDAAEPSVTATVEEYVEWLSAASKVVLSALGRFQDATSGAQCFSQLLVVDVVFSKILVTCYKFRLNSVGEVPA